MASSNPDKALKLALLVLFCGLIFIMSDLFEERVIQVGDKAPRFSVTTDGGRKIETSEFGGKLLVVNFWATWCPPCIEEMPSLNQFAAELGKEGVVVLGISVDKNETAYKSFLQQVRLAFQVARDPEADIPANFGTFKWPETYVINQQGKVVLKYIGNKTWTDPAILKEVRAHL
jgi:cytochrome c biogenesis protein CcmG/thiol:disulfide interchange protein DsbE